MRLRCDVVCLCLSGVSSLGVDVRMYDVLCVFCVLCMCVVCSVYVCVLNCVCVLCACVCVSSLDEDASVDVRVCMMYCLPVCLL